MASREIFYSRCGSRILILYTLCYDTARYTTGTWQEGLKSNVIQTNKP